MLITVHLSVLPGCRDLELLSMVVRQESCKVCRLFPFFIDHHFLYLLYLIFYNLIVYTSVHQFYFVRRF